MDRVNLHRLGDILEILSAELATGQIKLALDLIEHLASIGFRMPSPAKPFSH
jgi:hypothetical protein